jgi:hypothetical protein
MQDEIRTVLAATLAEPADTAAAIVERTNAFRKVQGLDALSVDDKLGEAARGFARFMARTGKYGHTADGRTPAQRAAAARYDYCLVAENIAYEYRSSGFASAAALGGEFVEGWKHSPEHRRNMLDPAATETGVGVTQGEQGRYFAVQMFGRPRSAAVRFSVENRSPQVVKYRAGDRRYTLASRVTRTHAVCRRLDSAITLPGSGRAFTVRPKDGARYTVTARGVEAS